MGRLTPLGAPATEDDILNNPDFAVLRKMLMRQGQPLPPESNVDEELPPQYEVDENGALASAAPATEDTEDTASFGALPSSSPAAVRSKMTEYQKLADDQAAFYDRMEKELLARRMGPTLSEKLFQIASALSQPTETRGFGASLANVMPVLQQQAQQRREGEISRADALQKLQLAQLSQRKDLLGQELTTEIKLQQLAAAKNKPRYIQTTDATGKVTLTPIFPGQTGQPEINPKDVQNLFRNPTNLPLDELKRLFDKTYGIPGLADQYLGGQK
jgi:hypothetical protein